MKWWMYLIGAWFVMSGVFAGIVIHYKTRGDGR
jgi:hypothetical protein